MIAIEAVIKTALNEVGYLEKKDNSRLDGKTENAGKNNWTKYARDLDRMGVYNTPKNGYSWCDMFVDWCFIKTFTLTVAMNMTGQVLGGYGAGCTASAGYYKGIGRFHKDNPKPGDQIFFSKDGGTSFYHTGLVYAVDDKYVYTVEGNTSSQSGVVENGGSVNKKVYSLSYSKIGGYGTPDYSIATVQPNTSEEVDDMSYEKFEEFMKQYNDKLKDNDSSKYSEAARAWAISTGLIAGGGVVNGEPNYMWESGMTREQFVTVLYRFAQMLGKA